MATTSDNFTIPDFDFNTAKRDFLKTWYNTSNTDIAPLIQRWNADANTTSPGGLTPTAGTAADSTHAANLLERATQGKTS